MFCNCLRLKIFYSQNFEILKVANSNFEHFKDKNLESACFVKDNNVISRIFGQNQ